jgi:hypothetical protein
MLGAKTPSRGCGKCGLMMIESAYVESVDAVAPRFPIYQ